MKIGKRDASMANLIFLADRVDIMAVPHYEKDILLYRSELTGVIEELGGYQFKPEFVDAFKRAQAPEAFWIALEPRHVTRYAWDMCNSQTAPKLMTLEQLRQMARIMAYVVDQKSPFTAQHSVRVGTLARHIATSLQLTPQQCEKIELAGFLHDLGKLRMPDEILEKPGPLAPIERATMNQHSYETYEILRRIDGLEDVAKWADYHHEGVDSTGYPFHPTPTEFTIEARIVAVADVFQALVQDRPYRKGMPLEQVLETLNELAIRGQLDADVVASTTRDATRCYGIAKGTDDLNRFTERPLITSERMRSGVTAHGSW